MIAIVSSNTRERAAFTGMCESAGWPCVEFDSVGRMRRSLRRICPKVIVTRYKLSDGYSDDVLKVAAPLAAEGQIRVIVLVGAGSLADLEVRQVSLGADVVLRDPIRADVIAAYLGRFRHLAFRCPDGTRELNGHRTLPSSSVEFAGAQVDVLARTMRSRGREEILAPRETALIQVLHEAKDQIVTYEMLYSEILDRRFNGDTSNLRVLLGKLCGSFQSIGIMLRPWVEVIPKTGYRYCSTPRV